MDSLSLTGFSIIVLMSQARKKLHTYDEEKPYASPTTHFEASLSSRYNCNRSKDNRGRSLHFSNRLAHRGEIVCNVNNYWFCTLSFKDDFTWIGDGTISMHCISIRYQ